VASNGVLVTGAAGLATGIPLAAQAAVAITGSVTLTVVAAVSTPAIRTFRVAADDRVFIVAADQRTFVVEDTRTWVVPFESRQFTVTAEDRSFAVAA
jgi:hypothetical protein